MTPKQKQAAIALLEKNCPTRNHYILKGKTCAVGCLALAAGVPKYYLKEYNTTFIEELAWVVKKIQAKFGMNRTSLERLQMINDEYEDSEIRRARVLEYMETL